MIDDKVLVDRFTSVLLTDRGLSQNTVDSYNNDMKRLLEWTEKHSLSLLTITTEDLQEYQAWLVNKDYKQTSRARMLSAIRTFFQHLIQEKIRSDDPSALLLSPKLPKRLPKDLSEAQVEALLDAPDPNIPLELRDKAMLELLYATGPASDRAGQPDHGKSRPASGNGAGKR